MKSLARHKQFRKDYSKVRLTDQHLQKFILYVGALLNGKKLPVESRDHSLSGEWDDFREFHLGGDQLVIYQENIEFVTLARMGSHAQLFRSM